MLPQEDNAQLTAEGAGVQNLFPPDTREHCLPWGCLKWQVAPECPVPACWGLHALGPQEDTDLCSPCTHAESSCCCTHHEDASKSKGFDLLLTAQLHAMMVRDQVCKARGCDLHAMMQFCLMYSTIWLQNHAEAEEGMKERAGGCGGGQDMACRESNLDLWDWNLTLRSVC